MAAWPSDAALSSLFATALTPGWCDRRCHSRRADTAGTPRKTVVSYWTKRSLRRLSGNCQTTRQRVHCSGVQCGVSFAAGVPWSEVSTVSGW